MVTFTFTAGTGALIMLGTMLLYAATVLTGGLFSATAYATVKKWLMVALVARLTWVVVYTLLLSQQFPYAISDDQSYHRYAMGYFNMSEDDYNWNFYYGFIKVLYSIFGETTLSGRIFNFFLSVYVVFPLAYIEEEVVHDRRFAAVALYALMPAQLFWCFFEIKDILAMFLFISGYAIIVRCDKKLSVMPVLFLVAAACLVEQVRSGMGFLLICIFLLCRLSKISSGYLKALVMGVAIFFGVMVFVGGLGAEYMDKIDDYQSWVPSTYSSSSMYSWFHITDISQVWKLPLCLAFYVLQPIGGLYGTGRLYFDYGFAIRMFDAGLCLFGVLFSYRYIAKERVRSLLFFVPLIFLACVNLTNSREFVFITPLLYLVVTYSFLEYRGNPIAGKGAGNALVGQSTTSLEDAALPENSVGIPRKGFLRLKFFAFYCVCASMFFLILVYNLI